MLFSIKITENTECRLKSKNKLRIVFDNASKPDNRPAILSGGNNAIGLNIIVQFINAVPEIKGGIMLQNIISVITAFCYII